ncbi:FAD/NAD(P)-binding domain-containing protein [Crucibulum laeve]|uniref:Sulfide:quinone oxidoreductase, mitochondrial n=1 Tax=Crucibulum laeve TaxID=68775 RepID=A0A5C3MB34_9AGAR|nr:FAD/NAD(P)-binding domain-containing protein [Crucibulum laeve]
MLAVSHRIRPASYKATINTVRKSAVRFVSTKPSSDKYKVVVVGGGSGGLSVANQIYDRFKTTGKPLKGSDVAIVDAEEYHYYQPGWTLVGAGLRPKTDFRRQLDSLIPKHIAHIPENVKLFSPKSSSITTETGREISYDVLVVAAGLQINWDGIKGLSGALADPTSGVSSIYSYNTCDKTWDDIESLRSGNAIFTQPAGVIKCAGAPQKIMWMAWDRYRRTNRIDNIKVDFYTGMPTMFSVKKYSEALNILREERGVGGYFQHNLIAIDSANHKATFKKTDGTAVDVDYTLLHATPPMGPLNVLKNSPIVDKAGWVSVNQDTLQHTNPEYSNIFSLGDCSSLPTSKTAAAITAQSPVLTENLFSFMDSGKVNDAKYDGYTSCPLLTGYGQLMLAEFKYGLEPKESFGHLVDQGKSQRIFYHFKKDLFPAAYWNLMVKGKWFGVDGVFRPKF